MNIYWLSYIMVPIAFIVMMKNYRTTNWLWLGFLLASLLMGIAPFVALAYLLVTAYQNGKGPIIQPAAGVTYHTDGSYTMYKPTPAQAAPSPGKTAFKVVGGVIAGAAIAFGLLIIGFIILISYTIATCPPSSKGC